MTASKTRAPPLRTRWRFDPNESRLTLQTSSSGARDLPLAGAEGSLELLEDELLGTTLRGRIPEGCESEYPAVVGAEVEVSGSVVAVRDDGAMELEGQLRTERECQPLTLVIHLGQYRERNGTEMLDLVVEGPLPPVGLDSTRVKAEVRVYRARRSTEGRT